MDNKDLLFCLETESLEEWDSISEKRKEELKAIWQKKSLSSIGYRIVEADGNAKDRAV